jgi:radical SAM superfamily enzyme YgiQ (UPF0313 family)
MIKIAFINPPHADWIIPNIATWLFMESHYNAVGKYKDQVEWLPAPYKFNQYEDIRDLYDEVHEADIILFSSYVWNYDLCDELAKYIKEQDPNKVTIVGGPHIGENEEEFLANRTYYDYVCKPTKPGESFMEDFINEWIETDGNPDPMKISWEMRNPIGGNSHPFPQVSVYEEHLDILTKMAKWADENDLEKFVIMETTRGCPYQCVFCEWGGGVGAKVLRKDIDIVKRDLLALKKAGYENAFLTDANFGMFEERDLEIFEFAWKNQINLTDISTMKAKDLERRKRLIDRCFEIIGKSDDLNSGCYPTVSIQSASEEAMKIAKRVDLSFEDKLELSKHINKKAMEGYNIPPSIELIMGMPGSTIEDFYNELEIYWNFKSWNSYRHDYMFLPDAENSKPEYVETHDIKLVTVYTDLVDEEGVDNMNTFYASKKNYFKTIRSCFSFTAEEMYEMFFMNHAGNVLLSDIYPGLETLMSPKEFGKRSYKIIKTLPGFDKIHNDIVDIYNPDTPPRSIKRLNGRMRTEVIQEFVLENKYFIINQLFMEEIT